jgi:hypothetical protein
MKWQKLSLVLLLTTGLAPLADGAVLPGLSMNQLRSLPPEQRLQQAIDLVTELLEFRAERVAQAPNLDPSGSNAQLIAQLKRDVLYDGSVPDDINAPEARARLAANLRLVDEPALTADPPKRLRGLELQTRWHATAIDGMCEQASAYIEFKPLGGAQGPDAPVKPGLVFVFDRFHTLASPTAASLPDATAAQRAHTDAECRKLEGQNISSDPAPDPAQALRMRWLVQSVNDALAKGSPPFTLDCSRLSGDCAKLISETLSFASQTFDCHDSDKPCEVFVGKVFRNVSITATAGPKPIISAVKLDMRLVTTAPPDRSTD